MFRKLFFWNDSNLDDLDVVDITKETVYASYRPEDDLAAPADAKWTVPAGNVTLTAQILGEGTFGRVKAGLYVGRRVAVKMLIKAALKSVVKELLKECDMLRSIQHANIVEFVGVAVTPDRRPLWLITERLERTLSSALYGSNQLSVEEEGVVLVGIARALVYLHRQRIIHLDVKSKNVLLDGRNIPKLCDLGTAKALDTHHVTTVGTLPYMAPEMKMGGVNRGTAVDIFSFGIVVAEVSARVEPHPLNEQRVGEDGRPEPVSEVVRHAVLLEAMRNPNLRGLAVGCLADDPSSRPTATEVLSMLHALARDVDILGTLRDGTMEAKQQAATVLAEYAAGGATEQADAARCVDLLVALLHDGTPEAKEQAATAIFAICGHATPGSSERQIAVARAGAIEPLVVLLREGTAGGKQQAAAVLGVLARSSENRVHIVHAGGIEGLVALLRDGTPGGKEQAAVALSILASDEHTFDIWRAGGIEPLLMLLRDGTPGGRERAAAALCNLAVSDVTMIGIAHAGGIDLLVALLRDGTSGGKEQAALALSKLAVSDENKVHIARAGGLEALVVLLHCGTPGGKEQAAAALRNLAGDESNARIERAGGIEALAALLGDGTISGKKNAAAALWNLAAGDVNRLMVLLHGDTSDGKEQAATALSFLVDSVIGRADVIQPLVALLRDGAILCDAAVEHVAAAAEAIPGPAFLRLAACIASRTDADRAAFRKYGGDRRVLEHVRQMRRYPDDILPGFLALDYLSQEYATASLMCEATTPSGLELLLDIRREYQGAIPVPGALISLLCRLTSHASLHPLLNKFNLLPVLDELALAETFAPGILELINDARRLLRGESSAHLLTTMALVPVGGDESIPPWRLAKIPFDEVKVDEDVVLGKGATAEVRRADFRGAPVAVKQFFGVDSTAQGYMSQEYILLAKQMRAREWEAARILGRHPNLAEFLGVAVDQVVDVEVPVATVFELMWGTLSKALYYSPESLAETDVVSLLCDVSCGLAYIHLKGFIHRDIKSDNVLLKMADGRWVPKIGDLARAKRAAEARGGVGAAPYMAPEMFGDEPVTDKADVFSLGVVIMEACLRKRPNPISSGGDMQVVPAQQRMDHLIELGAVNADLRALVERCIELRPDNRYSADEVHERLILNETSELPKLIDFHDGS